MGLLDDAIRQHLELKRAHGADEAELQRKESEALGPVRREAEPAADDGAEASPAPEADLVPETPTEQPTAFTDDDPFGDDEPFADPPEAVEEVPAVEEALPPLDELPPVEEPELEDALVVDDPPAAGEGSGNTPTRGFDALSDDPEDEPFAEEAVPPPPPPEPAGDADDVLEETPEFLQETPEHDRLWFEQKPPRDFDFDDDE